MRLHRFRFTIRGLMILVAVSSLMLSYAGSYYRLSRRGMQEATLYGVPGFLYVPFQETAACEDLWRHHTLAWAYAPLNWLDQMIFGFPGPTTCILRLGG
jgi:hypothetical protein